MKFSGNFTDRDIVIMNFANLDFLPKAIILQVRATTGGQLLPALQGGIGKLTRFFLKKFSGIELPEDGADRNDTIRLSPEHARQGGPYAYYLRQNDKKLVVKIPPGVKNNQLIRLAGMGEDGKGGGKTGDLYLKVHIRKSLLKFLKDYIAKLRK